MLNTFVLVNKGQIISPILITVREYAKWFEETFDGYTTKQELWKPAKANLMSVDWHPGSKIGKWFDSHTFDSAALKSWYISKDSNVMKLLIKFHLAEYSDICHNRKLNSEILKDTSSTLRVYTINQIEFYIKSTIDRNFDISGYVNPSKQIKVKDTDMDNLIIPSTLTARKKLF